MKHDQIKELALTNGFKLKPQPDGTEDLNPYVYEFAAALLAPLQEENERLLFASRHNVDMYNQMNEARKQAEQERGQLKAQLVGIQAVIQRDHSATRFSDICEIIKHSPVSRHRLQAKEVNVVSKTFPALVSGVNRPVLWHYQLDSIDTETLNTTNAVVIYSDIHTEIDPSGQHGNRQFTTVAITRAELRTMLKCLDDDIEQLKEHCPETEFS